MQMNMIRQLQCLKRNSWYIKSRLFSSSKRIEASKPFDKILIANRGEIACRVIRTAKKLGVQTVALYSVADGPESMHAKMADEAYQVGSGPSPTESYLLGKEVLEIAKSSGSQAIHPGYGFLSENSNFATEVGQSGLTFIGPPAPAILAMGSKSHSKTIMEEAGVPTTPGYHGQNQDPMYLKHEAVTNVGFPLLIKATMGGGGKGMRLVWKESDFLDALDSCKRESQAAFGDTNVILERYLVHPRHIEVQVIADKHGNGVYLHERDCSLQRRHQKIIEEAPASDLPADLRTLMGDTAVKAAKAVGYVNAGTVEFLLDSQLDNGDFYFCEMNTRLQVEHPVTEMITGQDLVEWQLRVAAGDELPITDQSLIPCTGHSMEARIYAENAAKDFLPATGKVWHHRPPVPSNEGGHEVRVDTGLEAGKEISVHYDPMVSKLIVHGQTREEARNKLIHSLKEYQIAGVPSNVQFLINCAQHPVFAEAGAINTGFLEEYANEVQVHDKIQPIEQAICALVASLALENRSSTINDLEKRKMGSWSKYSGSWRLGSTLRRILKTDCNLNDIVCDCNHDGSFKIIVDTDEGKETFSLQGMPSGANLEVIVDGAKKRFYTTISNVDSQAGLIHVYLWPVDTDCFDDSRAVSMSFEHPRSSKGDKGMTASSNEENGSLQVRAPMPGKITRINFKEGDKVNDSDVIITMEAMKMEHAVETSTSGYISKINCKVGDIVNDDEVLALVGDDVDEYKIAS